MTSSLSIADGHTPPDEAGIAELIAGAAHDDGVAERLALLIARHSRSRLTLEFVTRYGATVQQGIFTGMVLPEDTVWGDGDKLPKLLGSYESELHPIFEQVFAKRYATIVNVGCAEGYYAVGAALRQPDARVHAFDISEAAQRVCMLASRANRVEDRVTVPARCSLDSVSRLLQPDVPTLLIVDCEGGESVLAARENAARVATADLVIECHEFARQGITRELQSRLTATHEVRVIREGTRPPLFHPFLESLNGLQRAIATCEFRPEVMNWLFCEARVRPVV